MIALFHELDTGYLPRRVTDRPAPPEAKRRSVSPVTTSHGERVALTAFMT